MALKILLNYRRGDTAGNAGHLYATLAERFGKENVFMDIDKIDPGLNFVEVINDWVGRCDVFIAMIGTQWLDSAYKSGQRRLDDPNDFVRMEIESALERPDVRLIPVLVQDVDMPSAEQLPEFLPPGEPIEPTRPLWMLSDDVGTSYIIAGGGSSGSQAQRTSTFEFEGTVPAAATRLSVVGPGMTNDQTLHVELD